MSTIFRKTDKGQAEITTREHRLSPRLRSALILVDGKRSDDELRKMIAAEADETIKALRDGGFIEVLFVTADKNSTAAKAAAPAASAAPAGEARTAAETRRRAVRWIADRMGPMGDLINMRIEASKTPEELSNALLSARHAIRDQLGAAKALEFQDEIITPAGLQGGSTLT